MSIYVFDTDHLSLYQAGHFRVLQNQLSHIQDQLALTIISVEEQLNGWQTALRKARDDVRRAEVYRRMARSLESLAGWSILPFSLAAMARHAHLLRQHLNVKSNDLKIAAIAMERGATVVARNAWDFARIPGLMWEDWSI
jgi:tRNA(fMet)-specific endonuclease VapC